MGDVGKGGIRIQIISNGTLQDMPPLHICQEANDELTKAVNNHRTRLAGFAMLLINHSLGAAVELMRCVRDLGFKDTLIANYIDGRFVMLKNSGRSLKRHKSWTFLYILPSIGIG